MGSLWMPLPVCGDITASIAAVDFPKKDYYAFALLGATEHALVVEECFADNLYVCRLDHVDTMRNFLYRCYEYKKATKAATTPSKTLSCAKTRNGGAWKW